MWRGSFCEGRVIYVRDDNDSYKLADCHSDEELADIIDEIESDYRHQPPIWECDGCCVIDGQEIDISSTASQWSGVEFVEKHKGLISAYDLCAVSIAFNKGYSGELEINTFDSGQLTYDAGTISYGGYELFPEDWQGRAREMFLFREGSRIALPR